MSLIRNYKLYDHEIKTVLKAFDVFSDLSGSDKQVCYLGEHQRDADTKDKNYESKHTRHQTLSLLLKKAINGVILRNKDSKEPYTRYMVLNLGEAHWVWLSFTVNPLDKKISAYYEDSMSESRNVDDLKPIFEFPDYQTSVETQGTGKQKDTWTCGYRVIQRILFSLQTTITSSMASDKFSEYLKVVLNWDNNLNTPENQLVLRNSVLMIIQLQRIQNVREASERLLTELERHLNGGSTGSQINKLVEDVLRTSREIETIFVKQSEYFGRPISELDELNEIKQLFADKINQLSDQGLFDINDAIFDGTIISSYYDTLSRILGVRKFIEFSSDGKEFSDVGSLFRFPDDMESVILYKLRNDKLAIVFFNEGQRDAFFQAVGQGQFTDPQSTAQVATPAPSISKSTLLTCPTYKPKGYKGNKSECEFSMNLSSKEIRDNFLKRLHLLPKPNEFIKQPNGQFLAIIPNKDNPIFKIYNGAYKDSDGKIVNQENAIYAYSIGSLAQAGQYVKIDKNGKITRGKLASSKELESITLQIKIK